MDLKRLTRTLRVKEKLETMKDPEVSDEKGADGDDDDGGADC